MVPEVLSTSTGVLDNCKINSSFGCPPFLKNDAMCLYIVQKFVAGKIVKDVNIITLYNEYVISITGNYVHVNKRISNESEQFSI